MDKKLVEKLRGIKTFEQLLKFLEKEMSWPINNMMIEDLTFDYKPAELGLKPEHAANIGAIKRLRPLIAKQPWGIFFIEFEQKRLPVESLKRILGHVVIKKRATAKKADQPAWAADDLLFISNFGKNESRQISFAHFSSPANKKDLPTLKVLGWDSSDALLHLDSVAKALTGCLSWPEDENDVEAWREKWGSGFTLRHREVITTSKQLSSRLAELAVAIRTRINSVLEIEDESGPLTKLMDAFKSSLLHDLNKNGFADMYAQTIAYGLLSARIANPIKKSADSFADHMHTSPFLKELMETFLKVGGRRSRSGAPEIDFDELGVSEVVGLLDDANMEAVIENFGDSNPNEDPVIHFYELFLNDYDKKQKISRGVFYTPQPVVRFIVRSIDQFLRAEYGLANGLADTTTWREIVQKRPEISIPRDVDPESPFVLILDPATGTGTFLIEVIDVVYETLRRTWASNAINEKEMIELWNDYVPKYLLPRICAYELLMAPYAIAHLKVSLKLFETGYSFVDSQRARIYLANALEPPTIGNSQLDLGFPALDRETREVNDVKKLNRFTVILGNPPYAKISSNMGAWAQNLVKLPVVDGVSIQSYYEFDGVSMGERKLNLQDDYVKFLRLAQFQIMQTGVGVIGFITNRGYLGGPTFRGMRQSLLSSFSNVGIIDLHGDTKVGEDVPSNEANENVFEIQQGVAVTFLVRSCEKVDRKFTFSNVWGTRNQKYYWLHSHVASELTPQTLPRRPHLVFGASLSNSELENTFFESWTGLTSIFQSSVSGILTSRDSFVIGESDEEIRSRIHVFLDRSKSDEEVGNELGLTENYQWRISVAREALRNSFDKKNDFVDILYRPFDIRRILYNPAVVWRTRGALMAQMTNGKNLALVATRQGLDKFSHVFISRNLVEYKAGSHHRNCQVFPLYQDVHDESNLFGTGQRGNSNFSDEFVNRVKRVLNHENQNAGTAQFTEIDLFNFIYGVLNAPSYRHCFAKYLKMDFPRIPIPRTIGLFRKISELGGQVMKLHLLEVDVSTGRANGTEEMISCRIEKITWSENVIWIDRLRTVGFEGVSEEQWNFRVCGYQVCEKWLKDRKGRKLTREQLEHFRKVIDSIREMLIVMAKIDEVVESNGGWMTGFENKEKNE